MDFQNSFCLTYAVRRCNPSYAKELVRLLSKRPRTSYAVGDVVGVRVSRIDRSEMDDRILPCKVREHIAEADIDRVQCVHSIISNTYSAAALVDLTNATWPELEGLDMTASHVPHCHHIRPGGLTRKLVCQFGPRCCLPVQRSLRQPRMRLQDGRCTVQ